MGGFTVKFSPCRYVRFRAGAPTTAKFTPAEKLFAFARYGGTEGRPKASAEE